MKKLVFGATALVLLSSLISCRDAEADTTADNAETVVETPVVEEEMEAMEMESTTEVDSLSIPEGTTLDTVQ